MFFSSLNIPYYVHRWGLNRAIQTVSVATLILWDEFARWLVYGYHCTLSCSRMPQRQENWIFKYVFSTSNKEDDKFKILMSVWIPANANILHSEVLLGQNPGNMGCDNSKNLSSFHHWEKFYIVDLHCKLMSWFKLSNPHTGNTQFLYLSPT